MRWNMMRQKPQEAEVRYQRFAGWTLLLMMAVWTLALNSSTATGQERRTKIGPKRPPAKAKPTFENLSLPTKDGMIVACSYYPGPKGKQTVPVILLHGWKGSRSELHRLALYLQGLKHSVITVDFRGHGQSQPQGAAGRNNGRGFDVDKMRAPQIANMGYDIQAAKDFLLDKNNKEELNIELLCVFGAEFGANQALTWAVSDWSVTSYPALKKGQDVKALILISPIGAFKGVTTRPALSHPVVRRDLAVLIAAGREDPKSFGDAKRLHKSFERFHTSKNDTSLKFVAEESPLQGMPLVNARGSKIPQAIAQFIDEQLVKRSQFFPWRDRTGPFGE